MLSDGSPKTASRVDEARQKIINSVDSRFQDVLKIQHEIAQLKQSLNTLIPIAVLPTELLEKIFLSCVCAHESKATDIPFLCYHCFRFSQDPQFKTTIQEISQVCSSWRALVFSSPRMWAVVPISQPEWPSEELLRRAQSVPVYVQIDFDMLAAERHRKVLDIMFEHLPHVRELVIRDWALNQDDWLKEKDFSGRQYPYLRTLAIKADAHTYNSFPYPWQILQSCPAIEVLTIGGFFLHNPSVTLPSSLKELYLEIKSDPKTTTDELLLVMGALPLLVRLSVNQEADGELEDGLCYLPSLTVELPRLQYVRLDAFSVLLLGGLRLPATANISLNCCCKVISGWQSMDYTDAEEYAPVVSAIASHFSQSSLGSRDSQATLRSFRFSQQATLEAFSSSLSENEQTPRCRIEMGFYERTDRHGRSEIILSLCKAMALSDVRELRMCYDDRNTGFTQDCWPVIMEVMPLLEEVSLDEERSIAKLIGALTVDTSTSAAVVSLPYLRKLSISTLRTSCLRFPEDTDAFLAALGAMATSRKAIGYMLNNVTVDMTKRESSFYTLLRRRLYSEASFQNLERSVGELQLFLPEPFDEETMQEMEKAENCGRAEREAESSSEVQLDEQPSNIDTASGQSAGTITLEAVAEAGVAVNSGADADISDIVSDDHQPTNTIGGHD